MATDHDFLQRFALERAGVRGVLVRLDETWAQVRGRADYPVPLAGLLGQTLAASALFTGNIKLEGNLSIQLRNSGAVRLLFAQCSHDGRLRGLARWDGPVADTPLLDADTQLAVTIENTQTDTRYQGIVAADQGDLATAFEHYFGHSEQLPTRIVLAASDGRCAGIMLQRMPESGGTGAPVDADAWNRVGHLLATLSEAELLDLAPEELLLRLFHEETVRVFDRRPLAFGCSCSEERVVGMLRALGRDELEATLVQTGEIAVHCEFCNQHYRFDHVDVAAMLDPTAVMPGPGTAQ